MPYDVFTFIAYLQSCPSSGTAIGRIFSNVLFLNFYPEKSFNRKCFKICFLLCNAEIAKLDFDSRQ